MFIDADDWIIEDYLETLVSMAADYDCVASGYTSWNNENIVNTMVPSDEEYHGNNTIREAYINLGLKKWTYSPWGKLYKRDIATKVMFDEEMVVGEDIVYNLKYLKNSQSIKTIHYAGYCLRENNNSTTHRIASRYSKLYEHSYKAIQQGIQNAKRDWGFDEKTLANDRINQAPGRYYLEMTNLFRDGTPYTLRQSIVKIKTINDDDLFIEDVNAKDRKLCNRAEMMAQLCTKIHNPFILAIVFKLIIWIKN